MYILTETDFKLMFFRLQNVKYAYQAYMTWCTKNALNLDGKELPTYRLVFNI